MNISRRGFLALSGAAAFTILPSSARGANEKIRCAVAGVNNRGKAHIQGILGAPNAELVALCDVDATALEAQAREADQKTGKSLKRFRDLREVLADPEIDAITLALPNHWHVLGAIWGLQAGKHVYVEKPMCHTYWEGLQLVAAEKQYGKVLMHGTQRRSEPLWQRMVHGPTRERSATSIWRDASALTAVTLFPRRRMPRRRRRWTGTCGRGRPKSAPTTRTTCTTTGTGIGATAMARWGTIWSISRTSPIGR
ncbi:MAG: Gfo/Idh/MocA family oxidoreductase [Candidatus Hydrogenedentes bacterium]|nr:Gfo/Idh/MocA family oxidoreductase [Candidatus Hydrogenedentota bacterium]